MLMNRSVKLNAIWKTLFSSCFTFGLQIISLDRCFAPTGGKRGNRAHIGRDFFVYEFSLQSGSFPPKDWVIVTHCYQPVINTGWWASCFPLPKAEQKSAGSDTSLSVNVVITRDYCCFSGWTIVTGILTRQRNELLSIDLSCW